MKGIRQRNNKWEWNCTFNGTRRTGTAPTKKEAIQQREKTMERLRTGQEKVTLKLGYDLALQGPWKNNKALDKSMTYIQFALNYFGDMDMRDITEENIDNYVLYCEEQGNKPATINRKLSALSGMLKALKRRRYIDRIPDLPRQKERNQKERWVTQSEEKEMVEYMLSIGKPEHADVIMVLADTGLRIGELFNLNVRDAQFTGTKAPNGLVRIWQTKTDTARTVALTRRAKDILKKYIKGKDFTDKILPHTYTWFKKPWDRMKKALDLQGQKDLTPHILRHTCASRLAMAGVPLSHIAQMLGHSNTYTTNRYAHLAPETTYYLPEKLEVARQAEIC